MQKAEYQKLFENEEEHFYYASLHKLVVWSLDKYHPYSRKIVLDAGCGTGGLAQVLAINNKVFAVDESNYAVKLAKKKGVDAQKADINKLPFKSNYFDAVTCIDVLYHKKVNDKGALKEFYRVLAPGGCLVIRVAANDWLKTLHDKNVHTRKRYNRSEVRDLVAGNGFRLRKLSYMNMVLLPMAIFFSGKSFGRSNKIINSIMLRLINFENLLLHLVNLPQGIGVFCVAIKPK